MPDPAIVAVDAAALAMQDAEARRRALDPTRSFLVQAPAGSGKTELLIQRFLALLATVERPESIVAMTFTRKAAGEMRERVVGALRDAAAGVAVASAHERRTRELALAALERDRLRRWDLVAHPARLQIHTIDALCSVLARQAPLATGLGATPRFEEQAAPLYAQAARDALAAAAPDDAAWQRLLAHLDNDADRAVELLSAMLGRRDQWLQHLLRHDPGAFRAELEGALAAEIAGELEVVRRVFPAAWLADLADHQRYAATCLADDAALAACLERCAAAGGLPPAAVAALDDWRLLADWLLTKGGAAFRKTVATAQGFPPKGKAKGEEATARGERNDAMRELLAQLAAEPGLAATVDAARRLPPPRYADEAWALVAALLAVLPRVVAQLTVTFRDRGVIDFTQGTVAALEALGTEDEPTDLLLRLDFGIQHLLVDEFQDTSALQLELLRRLTAGWEAGSARTLFAVGDPMQSIYRFRAAEVRLFVEAQQSGRIGRIDVETLQLRRNFRSQANLVAWTNQVFPAVLGSHDDPWRGAVAFAPATPEKAPVEGPAATFDLLPDAAAEADVVVDRVRAALAAGAGKIAILVRARTHLDAVLPALRAAGIPFAAVDLDPLAERQAIVDLAALTHALLQPADRLAWLAVLRAPWCGLTLPDLFVLAAAPPDTAATPLASKVLAPEAALALTSAGRGRLERVAAILRAAIDARGRATLAARVRGAWLALGGPATLAEAIDLDAAERYFALLAQSESGGEVPDWAAFVAAQDNLYAAPEPAAGADKGPTVHVMTLHRAKGLQFDTVLIPGLARVPNRSGVALLRWRARPQGLLLAPMKPRGGEDDPVYRYLGHLAQSEEDAELGRLLYVGCTRAERRLHLTAVMRPGVDDAGTASWPAPGAGTAAAKLWGAVDLPPPPVEDVTADGTGDGTAVPPARRLLDRLPDAWTPPPTDPGVPLPPVPPAAPAAAPVFDWAQQAARHVGVVAHRLIARIAADGLDPWPAARIGSLARWIRCELLREGVADAELDGAATRVEQAVTRLVADERGRWLLAADHAEARSEWALAGVDDGAIVHVVLDRTFVADGVRWIVDFKIGAHEGADVEAFLDREAERYRDQLTRYARLVRALDPRPIRLGLYHPLVGGWREWLHAG
jgi:ATP-dependent exoDNAse (exonuclease V) beta subunit